MLPEKIQKIVDTLSEEEKEEMGEYFQNLHEGNRGHVIAAIMTQNLSHGLGSFAAVQE